MTLIDLGLPKGRVVTLKELRLLELDRHQLYIPYDISILLRETHQRGKPITLSIVIPDDLNWSRGSTKSPLSIKDLLRLDF